jgi:transcriptional regulator with XRE-family HTH domain
MLAGMTDAPNTPNNDHAQPDPTWLGEQIRLLRKLRKLSLQQLSEATGRSIGFLSQLERGKSQPSVSDLNKLATALAVPYGVFFSQAPAHERGLVVRQAHRPVLHYAEGVSDALLSPGFAGGLQLMLTRFAPGASSGPQTLSHGGDQGGMVLCGSLELWVDEQCHLLAAGDSFSFNSSRPHRYCNPGHEEAQVVWAYTVSA